MLSMGAVLVASPGSAGRRRPTPPGGAHARRRREHFFRFCSMVLRGGGRLYLEGVARTPRDSHAWQMRARDRPGEVPRPAPRGGFGGGCRGAYRLPRRFRRSRASRPDRSSRHVAHDRGVARARGPTGRRGGAHDDDPRVPARRCAQVRHHLPPACPRGQPRAARRTPATLLVGDRHLDRIHAALQVREDERLAELPEARTRRLDSGSCARSASGPDDSAVLSYELFAAASAEQAQRALADLSAYDVHVVVTARDLGRSASRPGRSA